MWIISNQSAPSKPTSSGNSHILIAVTRQQSKLPTTDEGHAERLRRAQERSHDVLTSELAQAPDAPTLGMRLTINLVIDRATGSSYVEGPRHELPNRSFLELAAMYARPFTLRQEAIYGPEIADSLLHFSTLEDQYKASEQLRRMWKDQPFDRVQSFSQRVDGTPLLPKAGVWNGEIGDRVLYSKLVHADDARELLSQIDDDHQIWSLASMVGDWLAIIAHQQMILQWVRPDICPELTSWAGSSTTIFDRVGVKRTDQISKE